MKGIENDFKTGTSHYIHGNTGNHHVSLKTANGISWLQFFVKAVGTSNQIKKEFIFPPVTMWVVFTRKWKKKLSEWRKSSEFVTVL